MWQCLATKQLPGAADECKYINIYNIFIEKKISYYHMHIIVCSFLVDFWTRTARKCNFDPLKFLVWNFDTMRMLQAKVYCIHMLKTDVDNCNFCCHTMCYYLINGFVTEVLPSKTYEPIGVLFQSASLFLANSYNIIRTTYIHHNISLSLYI